MTGRTKTRTARFEMGAWFNERTGHIHLAAKDGFISTVSNDPQSRRYHPNLYRKLTQALKERRLPCPEDDPIIREGQA